jgi:hypothetical protein
MRGTVLKGIHVLALGLWFGGAAFFNFVTAPAIFESFQEVVRTAPSDRTAFVPIVPPNSDDATKKDLASALAGSAVGPVFPKYFVMQVACGMVALLTALGWWKVESAVHRWRVYVVALALLTVAVGWPISAHVSDLRLMRFATDSGTATAAREAFGPWHLVSLLLSFVTVVLAGLALALAAKLPANHERAPAAANGT